MRIDRLRIQNFRRFKFVDLELPDGVIALVGRNGAGKSTLLESVGWCLYGHDAARTGKDLIKRRGAAPGDDVRVLLQFRFGAHTYEVVRELLGKSEAHVASVKVDGKLVVPPGAASSKEATAYVERLFHMDREAFFTTLVARQRELSALTDAKASDRKRLLIGLLRLDAVDGAIQLARTQRREARAHLAGVRSALVDPAALAESVQRAQIESEAARARVAEAEARIAQLVEEVESLREVRDAGRKRAEEHKLVLAAIRLAEQRVGHLAAQQQTRAAELAKAREAAAQADALAPRLAQIPEAKARLEALAARRVKHEELARVRAEMTRALADAQAAETEIAQAQERLAALGTVRALADRVATQRPQTQAAYDAAVQQASGVEASRKERARQLNEAEAKAKRIREMGPETPCPTCTRPLREHHGELLHGFGVEIDAHRAALTEMGLALAKLRDDEAKGRAGLAALAEREKELRVKLDKLVADETRLAGLQARVVDARARHERLAGQAAALGEEPYDAAAEQAARALAQALDADARRHAALCAQAERETDLVALLGELALSAAEAEAQRAAATQARDALGFDEAAHAAAETAAASAEGRLTEARVTRERVQGELARLAETARAAQAQIAQQEALAKQAEALAARVTLLELLAGDREQGLLPEFKDHLIGRLRPLLSNHAGRLFREMTEGRYADLEVAEDYGLRVLDEGQHFELARFSGGEGDLANLCLRLAVSQVVAERAGTEGFGFLALDEIFGSQDEIRKQNILLALKGLTGHFRQILIITHVGDVKDAAETVLRVEALEDGTSQVVLESLS
ncbi:MAG: repair protein SbcC/Rad50 [Thermoplasmata archaeon]|jgi:exonuclease SbcC|nr:repair protein SbcC/Rad50 [Thermoplasmata archaeon]